VAWERAVWWNCFRTYLCLYMYILSRSLSHFSLARVSGAHILFPYFFQIKLVRSDLCDIALGFWSVTIYTWVRLVVLRIGALSSLLLSLYLLQFSTFLSFFHHYPLRAQSIERVFHVSDIFEFHFCPNMRKYTSEVLCDCHIRVVNACE